MTEAQKRANAAYKKKCRILRVTIYPTERDILRKVESVGKYSTYIKKLIREDIEKERKNHENR